MALSAQGFYDRIPAKPNRSSLTRALERTNLFQIDSVNVLVRSHYLPLFSRLGAYPLKLLQDAAWGAPSKRMLFEYWAHEASLIPLSMRPLFHWRMEEARSGKGMWGRMTAIRRKRTFVRSVLAEIESGGAATASSFKKAAGSGSWWGWSEVKVALEYLFWAGYVTAATRTNSFERVYDLPERVFNQSILSARVPDKKEAHRELLLLALRAMGVATEADLRDYFRLELLDTRRALRELCDAALVLPAEVDTWKQPAYVLPAAVVPRGEPDKAALLSPFDSLIWNRARAHRLFDFHYRIEIYTPAHKRVHGYYVLPFLHKGRLVARVDLKANRSADLLLVQGEHYESATLQREARTALRAELSELASWLGLDRVQYAKPG